MSGCSVCAALERSATGGRDLDAGLDSLWGLDDPDLRLCPRCGDWFVWRRSVAPGAQALTRLARPMALVMEELLSGTARPREAVALVEPSLLAMVVDHLNDDALAPLLEPFVEWFPSASGALGVALQQRLEAAARSSRFNARLTELLGATPSSKRARRLLRVCLEPGTTAQRPKPLAADEVADFWALGVPLEAVWVPEDEWARAIAETRVQEVSSYSSMGTAETGWVRCTNAKTDRRECAVVPPGQTAEHTEWGEMFDDRDTTAVCWQPFWNGQVAAALRHVQGASKRSLLVECARWLKQLERGGGEGETQQTLVGWLDEVRLGPEALERALVVVTERSLTHLVRGVRARWLEGDCRAAVDAVLTSAERGRRDFWGHGDTAREALVRMELLRFIVRLVSRGELVA
ncbi:MAG: hypothetical protein GQE15_16800 [Archangiaceae bacterium]|nr:hypothetical protein [Archangiaceae bacterium]